MNKSKITLHSKIVFLDTTIYFNIIKSNNLYYVYLNEFRLINTAFTDIFGAIEWLDDMSFNEKIEGYFHYLLFDGIKSEKITVSSCDHKSEYGEVKQIRINFDVRFEFQIVVKNVYPDVYIIRFFDDLECIKNKDTIITKLFNQLCISHSSLLKELREKGNTQFIKF